MDLPAHLQKLSESTFNVDTLASESGVADEIDTGTTVSPVTVLTPSSGNKLDLRSVYLSTDSTSGTITALFADSGQKVGVIYCSKFAMVTLQEIRITGQTNDSIQVSWTGIDTGSKIFYAIRYKEI